MTEPSTTDSTENTTAETEVAAEVTREVHAQTIVKNHMLVTLGAGLVPVPLVDIALVSGIQLKMLHSLAELYEQEFNKELGKSVIGALLGGVLPVQATGSVAKLIPGVGTISGMISMSALSSATTYALGKVFIQHFESGGTLLSFDVEAMRGYFLETLEEGKNIAARLRKAQKTPETAES